MTVICPSCDARFRDPPEDVLLNRVLQCSRCEHEWSTSKAQKPRIKADAPTMAPDMKNLVDDEKAIKTALPVVMPKTDNEKQTQPIYVDREPETKTSKPFSLVWPATGMVCLMLLAGAVGLRTTIMNAVPQSVGLYQAAGTGIGQSGTGNWQCCYNPNQSRRNPSTDRSWRNRKHC